MRTHPNHLAPHLALSCAAMLLLAACGGSGTPAPSAGGSAATPTPTPAAATSTPGPATTTAASKGPATAQFSLVGSNGLSGPVTAHSITCGGPTLDGPQITVLGQSGTSGPDVVIFIRAAHVEVRVATGSAQTLKLRSFVGTGVTGFDANTGATLDSPLTESTQPGTATAGIGSLSSISGTIDCGNEQAGSTSLVVTGTSPLGALSGNLTGIRVTCTVTASGTYVGTSGLMTAGADPVLVIVTANTAILQVAVEGRNGSAFYTSKAAGIVTESANGAHVDGDATPGVAAGATPSPYTVHVAGDSICGTTVQP